MMNSKVSVLMPCYNAEKYFREAIESIINQTYINLEIILIDDGSTDKTKDLILEYAEKDARIVPVFNDTNLGLIRTLNKGVTFATGEFIARMDSDDRSHLNRIKRIIEEFKSFPELDVVSAGFYYITPEGKTIQRSIPKATQSVSLKFVSFFCTPVNHPCVIVKSKVFKDNLFDTEFIHSEDYEIFSRLLFLNYQFKNLIEPLYFLRMNPESVSYKFEAIQINTHTRISLRNIENYFSNKPEFFLHKVVINRISFSVSLKLLKEAFNYLESLKSEFTTREHVDNTVQKEILEFLIEQKIDILLQSIKKADLMHKPALVIGILKNMNLFFSERGFNYISAKMRVKQSRFL